MSDDLWLVVGFALGVVAVLAVIAWGMRKFLLSGPAEDPDIIDLNAYKNDDGGVQVVDNPEEAQMQVAVRTFQTGKPHVANQRKDGKWEIEPLW